MRFSLFCGIALVMAGSAMAADSEDKSGKWVLDHKHPNGICTAEAPDTVGPVTVRLSYGPDQMLGFTIAKTQWSERTGTFAMVLTLADLPPIELQATAHDRGYSVAVPPGVRPALLAAQTVMVKVDEGSFQLSVAGIDKAARNVKACVTRLAHKKPGADAGDAPATQPDETAKPMKRGKATL